MGKTNCLFNYYMAGHGLIYDAFVKSDKLFLEALAQGTPVENEAPRVVVHTVDQ